MTPPAPPAGGRDGRAGQAGAAALRLLGRHGLFAAALLAGAVLRLFAVLGFRPVLWFNDSYEYVGVALRPQAYPIRPDGYSWFLRLLLPLHSFTAVVVVQHLLGLAVAAALYLLLRRWAVPGWLAAVAMLPQLLSARQVALEHMVMSDTLFAALLVGAVVVLGWPAQPAWWHAAGAGAALSAATLVRSLGLPLLALAGLVLLVRRAGWRPVLAFGLVAAVPLVGYAGYYHSQHGRYELSNSDGVFLYARAMSFADCARMAPPPDLAPLCDETNPPTRRPAPSYYIWHPGPLDRLAGPLPRGAVPADRFTPARNGPARRFALLAIRRQPVGYARTVLRDVARSFVWTQTDYPGPLVSAAYRFSARPVPSMRPRPAVFVPGGTSLSDTVRYEHGPTRTRVVQPAAGHLIGYQRAGWLPGPVLAGLLVVGLAGLLAFRRRDGRRWQVLLLWSTAVGLLVLPSMTAEFDPRYVLPAVPLACAAAALAAHLLAGRPGPIGADEPTAAPGYLGGEPAAEPADGLGGEPAEEPAEEPAGEPGTEPAAEPPAVGEPTADPPAVGEPAGGPPGRCRDRSHPVADSGRR